MKPGQVVVLNDTLAIYGKLSPKTFKQLKSDPHFAYQLNKKLGHFWNWSIRRMLKAGNKFLKQKRLDPIEMLNDDDIRKIRETQEGPVGALLCRFKKGYKLYE